MGKQRFQHMLITSQATLIQLLLQDAISSGPEPMGTTVMFDQPHEPKIHGAKLATWFCDINTSTEDGSLKFLIGQAAQESISKLAEESEKENSPKSFHMDESKFKKLMEFYFGQLPEISGSSLRLAFRGKELRYLVLFGRACQMVAREKYLISVEFQRNIDTNRPEFVAHS
jgi:hypothetical protein